VTSRESPLSEYRRKRDFERSPEPGGSDRPDAEPSSKRRFFIQKHAARRLHFDLRLELDGVLKSWAVPKGPSLDPGVRRLAVHVEDHPLEYGSFEGTIPHEEYGGGTVLVWDRGSWLPGGDPDAAYRKGRLDFRLEGERLQGRWRLIRMSHESEGEGRNWLLQKMKDARARTDGEAELVETETRSVLSGRTLEEIAAEREEPDTDEDASGAPRGAPPPPPEEAPSRPLPDDFRPQLPVLVKTAPRGDEWLHELKFDGYRILARIEGNDVRLVTRRGQDWTARFGRVAPELAALGVEGTMVDGEVAVLAPDGTTDFQALQNILAGERGGRIVFFAFDLPFYRGRDLTRVPLAERRELLRDLISLRPAGSVIRYSDHIRGHGGRVMDHACRLALEGIVAKRADSRYREGRSRSWVKVKCLDRQEFVVGGWTEPRGSREGFGALLLGWFDGSGRLRYAGRVGTGFSHRSLARVRDCLEGVAAEDPPFADPPSGRAVRAVHWVRPELVVEIEFGSWTDAGLLRHAAFRGLREDKDPREVTREPPARGPREGKPMRKKRKASTADSGNRVAGVRLTNPDRVLFPEQGCTKRDLARYYETVADRILPHVVDRPLTLVRCPQGREKQCFYQKHLTEGMPEPVRGIRIEETEGSALYVGIDDTEGLVTLVQFGVLEIHPWGSRADRLGRPDRLIFDLDPGEGVRWKQVVGAALRVRERLGDLGLTTFVRTTGGKGIHVVAPLVRRSEWDEVKGFAGDVARGFEREDPDRFIATMSKARRKGRIFVDYLRNARGATAVASYSTRAKAGAPVATPLGWDELERLSGPDHYTIVNLPARLRARKKDPWEGFFDVRQSLTRAMREGAAG
jgi:bifunctional non-homologous end joining protein LigD